MVDIVSLNEARSNETQDSKHYAKDYGKKTGLDGKSFAQRTLFDPR